MKQDIIYLILKMFAFKELSLCVAIVESTEQVQVFRDHYFSILVTFRIAEKTHPWSQKHVEKFAASLPAT